MLTILALIPLAGSADYLIVPGHKVGHVRLGERLDDVTRRLGQTKFVDAAMGHIWQTWKSQSGSRIDIYAVRGAGDFPLVRIIWVTSKSFCLANGDHTGLPLRKFRNEFPGAKLVGSRAISGFVKVQLWDDKNTGISFESRKNVCLAIAAHVKGIAVDSNYLPSPWSAPGGE